MAAPGAAFAGQPGWRAGHDHAAADPGHRPHAAREPACRLVRACLQPAIAIVDARSGHRPGRNRARPPRPPPGPGPAPASCTRSTCTAPTARTTPSASRSKMPSTQTPAW